MLTQDEFNAQRRTLEVVFQASRPGWYYYGEATEGLTHQPLRAVEPAEVLRLVQDPRSGYGNSCRGKGYHRSFDTDYDCGGCEGCRTACPEQCGKCYRCRGDWRIGWGVAMFLRNVAVYATVKPYVDALPGLEALAKIGAQIDRAMEPGRVIARTIGNFQRAAGTVGRRIAKFLGNITKMYNRVEVGRCYEVTGRRGRAAQHYGVIGVAMRVEQDDYGTDVVQLQPVIDPTQLVDAPVGSPLFNNTDRSRPFRVSVGSVSPVRAPAAAAPAMEKLEEKRARLARPRFTGGKGSFAYVISGKHAGASGRVFWYTHEDRTGRTLEMARYGIRMETRESLAALKAIKKTPRGQKADWSAMDQWTLWVDACDLADAPMPAMSEQELGAWMTQNAPEVLDMVEIHIQLFCRVIQWANQWKEPGVLAAVQKPAKVAKPRKRSPKERQVIPTVSAQEQEVERCVHGIRLDTELHCSRCRLLQENG